MRFRFAKTLPFCHEYYDSNKRLFRKFRHLFSRQLAEEELHRTKAALEELERFAGG